MIADLHVHSRYSDGSMTPPELVAAAVGRGLDAISLVDHDTTAATEPAIEAGARVRLAVIPGVEISAYDFKRQRKVHILGYNYRLPATHIEALCGPIRAARHENTLRQVEQIRAAGYAISIEQVAAQATGARAVPMGDVLARPYCLYKQHIMLALIESGYTDQIYSPLYRSLFKDGGPADHDIQYVDAVDAIRAIHDDGGYAILAHPGQLDSFEYVPDLVRAGLDGVEAYHESHSADDRKAATELVRAHGLIATGGTDFHGAYGSELELGDICAPAQAVYQLTEPEDETMRWTIGLVRNAGAVARRAAVAPISASLKGGDIRDLVTEHDVAVERFLIYEISQRFPHDGFVTEEHDHADQSGGRWVIDPIDGTTNFVTSRSSFAVCVARVQGSVTQLGIVYDVMSDTLFHAAHDTGAFVNGVLIRDHGRRAKLLHECVIECSLSAAWDLKSMEGVNADALARATRAQRAVGSAALAICEVARGSRDAYVSTNLHVWDFAAAALILTEAGGAYRTGLLGNGTYLFVGAGHPDTLEMLVTTLFPAHLNQKGDPFGSPAS